MHRQMGQPSFAETLLSHRLGQNVRLEAIGKVVDWESARSVGCGSALGPRGQAKLSSADDGESAAAATVA